jgi:hypothetical protein
MTRELKGLAVMADFESLPKKPGSRIEILLRRVCFRQDESGFGQKRGRRPGLWVKSGGFVYSGTGLLRLPEASKDASFHQEGVEFRLAQIEFARSGY